MANNIVAFDLEFTDETQKIIEIGLTVAHLPSRKILDKQHFFVNPNETLSDYIKTLTSITQQDVDTANDISQVMKDVSLYLYQYSTHKQPITWGSGDLYQIRKQAPKDIPFPFGYTEMNIKCIHQAIKTAQGVSTQGGLSKSMNYWGLKFEGIKHRAIHDSYNTMRLYFKILDFLKK